MKYLLIGDLHFKEKLGYSDYISDGRVIEKNGVLDTIVNLSNNCDKVIFMGDQLNGRNNPSEVIKDFVQFVERFNQDIYILAGNHEKVGDGKSAIDFMKEVKKPNWHIITDKVEKIGDDVFCPYFFKGEIGANNNKDGSKKLLEMLPNGKYLFSHHAVSGFNVRNIKTDDLNEIILSKKDILKKYTSIFCGHIHLSYGDPRYNVLYTGSIFTNEANEGDKYVFILDTETNKITEHLLPCRSIIKIEDPNRVALDGLKILDKNSIVKIVLTKKVDNLDEIKSILARFDGSILLEEYKTEREVIKFEDGDLDLDITNLLAIYSKTKKIDLKRLVDGFNLIK